MLKIPGDTAAAYSWFARLGCGDGGGGCGLWADVTSFPVADSRMVSLEIWPHPSGRQRDAHGKITRYNRSGARASLWRADVRRLYTFYTLSVCRLPQLRFNDFFFFIYSPFLFEFRPTGGDGERVSQWATSAAVVVVVVCTRPAGALPRFVRICCK